MADILAELEGFLGKEAADKIRGSETMKSRMAVVNDVMGFYEGDTEIPPAPPQRRETPPEVRPATGAGDPGLAAIMAKLDSIGDVDAKIKSGVETVVAARGNELVNNAIAIAMRNTRELQKIDTRHRADFGTEFDDVKLEAHVAAAIEAGRPFRTITEAYEDMTREDRVAKRVETGIETGVREGLKARASGTLPGVTPTAATPMLQMLKTSRRGTTGNGDAGNHLDKAGAALAERLANNGTFIPA